MMRNVQYSQTTRNGTSCGFFFGGVTFSSEALKLVTDGLVLIVLGVGFYRQAVLEYWEEKSTSVSRWKRKDLAFYYLEGFLLCVRSHLEYLFVRPHLVYANVIFGTPCLKNNSTYQRKYKEDLPNKYLKSKTFHMEIDSKN